MKNIAHSKNFNLSLLHITYILLFVVVLLGLLLRTVGLSTGNMLFLYDNGHDLLFVKKLAVDHKPLLVGSVSSSIEGYFHGVFWFYMLAIPFILGKGNPVT
ncbi:MAG: hypothetical protein KGL95_15440, partial [Patescibacteria group bacterium]|nr:hypothetical protein [Patescibacteria group bacterium]